MLDLAVAVIIGTAFEDRDQPDGGRDHAVVRAIFGGLDFSRHFATLGPVLAGYQGSMKDYAAFKAAGAPVLCWGEFVTVVINFLILTFIIFLLVRWATKLMSRRQEAETPAGAKRDRAAD